jgi:hypothetical protein
MLSKEYPVSSDALAGVTHFTKLMFIAVITSLLQTSRLRRVPTHTSDDATMEHGL